VSIEKFGLGLATVGTLSVPPAGAATINNVSRCTSDDNILARD
jgi:hypothetical protein